MHLLAGRVASGVTATVGQAAALGVAAVRLAATRSAAVCIPHGQAPGCLMTVLVLPLGLMSSDCFLLGPVS